MAPLTTILALVALVVVLSMELVSVDAIPSRSPLVRRGKMLAQLSRRTDRASTVVGGDREANGTSTSVSLVSVEGVAIPEVTKTPVTLNETAKRAAPRKKRDVTLPQSDTQPLNPGPRKGSFQRLKDGNRTLTKIRTADFADGGLLPVPPSSFSTSEPVSGASLPDEATVSDGSDWSVWAAAEGLTGDRGVPTAVSMVKRSRKVMHKVRRNSVTADSVTRAARLGAAYTTPDATPASPNSTSTSLPFTSATIPFEPSSSAVLISATSGPPFFLPPKTSSRPLQSISEGLLPSVTLGSSATQAIDPLPTSPSSSTKLEGESRTESFTICMDSSPQNQRREAASGISAGSDRYARIGIAGSSASSACMSGVEVEINVEFGDNGRKVVEVIAVDKGQGSMPFAITLPADSTTSLPSPSIPSTSTAIESPTSKPGVTKMLVIAD